MIPPGTLNEALTKLSQTEDGKFVFDLKAFSVRFVFHCSPFIVSIAWEIMNFPCIVGDVLQIKRLIYQLFHDIQQYLLCLFGLNVLCFLCNEITFWAAPPTESQRLRSIQT